MATTPDANPDSPPIGPSEDVERVSPADGSSENGEAPEDSTSDSPGSDGGTSGTGGTNHRVDRDVTS